MPSAVRVFDGVFSLNSTERLRAACLSMYRTDTSVAAVYERGKPINLIEAALDSFLDGIADSGQYVEYWRRGKWAHVSMHRDIDEARSRYGDYHYPTNGHVLYLDIGTKVAGPTVVMWRPSAAGSGSGMVATVPAVRGRVLRFNGSLLHAVPRPHDAWLLASQGLTPGPEREYGLYEPHAPERRRDVLLFNVWAERPPMGLERGDPTELDPLLLAEPAASWAERELRVLAETGEREVAAASPPSKLASSKLVPSTPPSKLAIDMMGDCVRRGRDERQLELTTSVGAVAAAFASAHAPIAFPVHTTADIDAGTMSVSCRQMLAAPRWPPSRVQEMLKTARGGGDGIAPLLDEMSELLSSSPRDRELALLPNDLVLEIAAGFLDRNDASSARKALMQAVGPVAARVHAALAREKESEGGAVYAERLAAIRDPHVRPARRFSAPREWLAAREPLPTAAELAASCEQQACVIRGWAQAVAPALAAGFVPALREACASLPVTLSTRGATGGGEGIRIQRNGAWTDTVELGRFLGQPRGGVFVEEAPLEVHPTCAEFVKRAYVVPRFAAADYLAQLAAIDAADPAPARAAGEIDAAAPAPARAAGGTRRPSVSLSAHHVAAAGGIRQSATGFVLVLHQGTLAVDLYPFSPRDVALFLYPEHVLADRWNGSTPADLDEPSCALRQSAFPSVKPPLATLRYPLLSRGHEARISVELGEGDALFVPACLPFALSPTAAATFTSIRVVDQLSWPLARHLPAILHSEKAAALEALHEAGTRPRAPARDDVPFATWGAAAAQAETVAGPATGSAEPQPPSERGRGREERDEL